MRAPVLQLGFLIDFPPLLGPVLIGIGTTILTLWYVQTQLVPALADGRLAGRHQRARIVAPTVLGILLIALGMAVWARVVWVIVVVLFALGRAIEGGVTIRTIRRIRYYLGRVAVAVRPWASETRDTSIGLSGYLRSRILYRVSTIIVVVASITLTTLGVIALRPTAGYALSLVWATAISTTSVFVFVWDLRAAVEHIDAVPLIGILFCILGTEVYNFSTRVLPTEIYARIGQLVPEVASVFLVVPDSAFQYVLYLLGWGAYVYGIAIAVYVLISK